MDKEELQKELIESSKKSEKAIVWNFSLGSFHFAEFNLKTIRRDRNELVFTPTSPLSIESLKEIVTGLGKLNIFLTERKLFLRVNFNSLSDDNLLTTSLPDLSMIEDRRGEGRLIVEDVDVNLVRNGKFEKAILNDISTGGASLYIVERKSFIPQVEDIVENLHIMGEGLKKTGPGRVVSVKKIPAYEEHYPYPVWKISLSFDTELNLEKYLKEL